MQIRRWPHSFIQLLFVSAFAIGLFDGAGSVPVPDSNCYALDNSSRLVDFSSWIGHPFEYDGKEFDLVVRFCKDVETRGQAGYVDFGRFDPLSYFVSSSGHFDFVQGFYHGDLANCEQSYDKLGRTAQVNIICGNCVDGRCKGGLGCICSVTQDSTCRVTVELAIPCEKPGPRVFKGFTVGLHPRSWELIYNGMTQFGFDKPRREFSFKTEQTHLTLYMTAIASLSTLVGKPIIKVSPENGLNVKISGSSLTGNHPTTLSPSTLVLDWNCEKTRKTPYEVNVTIPVDGYDPVQFFLTKLCEYNQGAEGGSAKGWAIFGVFSCVSLVAFTLFRLLNLFGQIMEAATKQSVTNRLLTVKSASGKTYSQLAAETGLTNVYVAQLLRRQAQLKPETVPKLREALPALTEELIAAMMSPPWRSYDPNLIQEPTVYRLNEAVMHFGESIKEIINEDFGDGIMSAIDFYCSVDKVKGVDGNNRVVVTLDGKYLSHSEQRTENMVSRLNLKGSTSE